MRNASKIGAILYMIWGLIHVIGGVSILFESTVAGRISMQASARSTEEFAAIVDPAVNGIVGYHGFNLIWFGVFAFVVSATLIWRNLELGYWLNFLILGVIEIGLINFMLLPGFMKWADGSIGLTLYLFALFTTSIGFFGTRRVSSTTERKTATQI